MLDPVTTLFSLVVVRLGQKECALCERSGLVTRLEAKQPLAIYPIPQPIYKSKHFLLRLSHEVQKGRLMAALSFGIKEHRGESEKVTPV